MQNPPVSGERVHYHRWPSEKPRHEVFKVPTYASPKTDGRIRTTHVKKYKYTKPIRFR